MQDGPTREWLSPSPTLHERLLCSLVAVSPLIAQVILAHYSLMAFFRTPRAQVLGALWLGVAVWLQSEAVTASLASLVPTRVLDGVFAAFQSPEPGPAAPRPQAPNNNQIARCSTEYAVVGRLRRRA